MTQSNEKSRLRSQLMGSMKDQVEGVSHEKNDIYQFAVKILDKDVLKVLINKKHAWRDHREKFDCEGMPYVATKEFRDLIKKQTTLNAHNTAHKENWAMLRYAVSNAEDPDVASTKLVKWLIQYVDNTEGEDVTQIYMSGKQGAGKTEFAFLIAEIWLMMNPDGRILTNVKNVDDTIFIEGRDSLQEWLDENEGTPFIFIMDEMNKHAHGDDHRKVMKQLFGLITYLRKKKGNYVIMGHTGNDIHPAIRELCDYIYKKSNKVAEIFRNVDDSGEGEDHIKTIRGIPTSTLKPDTFDESDWSWSDENVRQCLGTNSDGDRCGAVTRSDWDEEPDLFCDAHQNQSEPHEDVLDEELIDTEFEDLVQDENEEDEVVLEDEPDSVESDSSEGETSGGEEDQDVDGDEDRDRSPDETKGDTSSQDKNSQTESIDEEGSVGEDEKSESQTQELDQSEQRNQPSTSSNLDDVPEKYWDEIEEQTGGLYDESNVDSIERVKQLLTESKREQLEEELE